MITLISLHMPKTAGKSFRKVLDAIFNGRIQEDYGSEYSFIEDEPPGALEQCYRAYYSVRRRAKNLIVGSRRPECIHGHFGARRHRDSYPLASTSVWLRNPVDRLVSHYEFWKRQPDRGSVICNRTLNKSVTFEQFALTKSMQNYQFKMLQGLALEDFSFVGVQENYSVDVVRFLEQFGYDISRFRDNWRSV